MTFIEEIERVAMNIVYQLDDDSDLSVEFRQANNDRRIDFVAMLIGALISRLRGGKCSSSPHCSHNTNGRDLDKPCSVELKP